MSKKNLITNIKEKFNEQIQHIIEDPELTIVIERDKVLEFFQFLKDSPDLNFESIIMVTAIDYEDHCDVVYKLLSLEKNHRITVKVPLPKDDLQIHSATSIWKGADWLEREVYDMFGITFKQHPDLRRILMPEDFDGYPLRKEFPLRPSENGKDW
jgi:NADH-quinone oxidoreductase subunit C